MATPVEVCSERDVKGLYACLLYTAYAADDGFGDPFGGPLRPENVIHTQHQTPDQPVEPLSQALRSS